MNQEGDTDTDFLEYVHIKCEASPRSARREQVGCGKPCQTCDFVGLKSLETSRLNAPLPITATDGFLCPGSAMQWDDPGADGWQELRGFHVYASETLYSLTRARPPLPRSLFPPMVSAPSDVQDNREKVGT